jgi:hypothetical protein
MIDTADEFRKQAEECRQLAATALKAIDKAFWLRLAEDWLKLAQEADKPTKQLTGSSAGDGSSKQSAPRPRRQSRGKKWQMKF